MEMLHYDAPLNLCGWREPQRFTKRERRGKRERRQEISRGERHLGEKRQKQERRRRERKWGDKRGKQEI